MGQEPEDRDFEYARVLLEGFGWSSKAIKKNTFPSDTAAPTEKEARAALARVLRRHAAALELYAQRLATALELPRGTGAEARILRDLAALFDPSNDSAAVTWAVLNDEPKSAGPGPWEDVGYGPYRHVEFKPLGSGQKHRKSKRGPPSHPDEAREMRVAELMHSTCKELGGYNKAAEKVAAEIGLEDERWIKKVYAKWRRFLEWADRTEANAKASADADYYSGG